MAHTKPAIYTNGTKMQAILAIIQSEDSKATLEGLRALDLPCMERIASSGSFLRQSNTALWLAARTEQVEAVLDTLRQTCHRRVDHVPAHYTEETTMIFAFSPMVEVGGATIFILDIEHYEAF
jgi:uncharacterized protein YaaQ